MNRRIAWSLLAASFLAWQNAAADGNVEIRLPLNTAADVRKPISSTLTLRVFGAPDDFEVEVTSIKKPSGCPNNLIWETAHGPDRHDVMPWHIVRGFYPNSRCIEVCGYPVEVCIDILSPEIAGAAEDEHFTGGELRVTVFARQKSRVTR